MATRIHALAQELGLKSKELLELCAQAGLEIKQNALASLTDEERERVVAAVKKSRGEAVAAAAPAVVAVVAGTGSGGVKTASPSATIAAAAPRVGLAPMRREDYVSASGVTGRVPTLDRPRRPLVDRHDRPAEKPAESEAAKAARRRETPLPRLAALPPTRPRPVSREPKPAEPPAQKPDLRLPPEAIRGRKPLEEHLRKHEEDKKRRAGIQPAPAAPPIAVAEIEDEEGKAARAHRGGIVAGREERQRRRGRRAAERRREQDEVLDPLKAVALAEEPVQPRGGIRRRHAAGGTATLARKTRVQLTAPVTVRALSEAVGVRASELIRRLVGMGTMVSINGALESETVQLLAAELGMTVEIKKETDAADQLLGRLEQPDAAESLESRPPVVTFLGHVDHGKTSLLDAMRQSNVVAEESGGITQHIGAYQVSQNGRRVTFVDTPGHEAFTAMRARGANVTDIAVLVVAADDGVMPQTEEALNHAKAAGVPIVVALNKVDLPNANVQRTMQQLAQHGLMPVEWGGDTEFVQTSATKRQGLEKLVETLSVVAELHDFKANPKRPAVGTCLEASLSEGRGVMATVLVQNGTLSRGDVILCGEAYGRVKAMFDDRDRPVASADPATPVKVSGLNVVPAAGDKLYVLDDLSTAREMGERRKASDRKQALAQRRQHVTLENLFGRIAQGQVRELRLVLKADTRGSIEAIRAEVGKLKHPEVQVRVLHEAVGGITESDVLLADASDGVVLGFHVVPDDRAQSLAETTGVEIRRYEIIYQVVDDIRKALEGMLEPEKREVQLGRAVVREVFKVSRVGTVAGCYVTQGTLDRSSKVRLIRDGRVIYPEPGSGKEASTDSLKRFKDDVREVREGLECGIKIAGYDDIKVGDVIEAYKIEEVKRTL